LTSGEAEPAISRGLADAGATEGKPSATTVLVKPAVARES